MDRRGFLATLFFALAGGWFRPRKALPKPLTPPRVPLVETFVAGFRFHDGPELEARLAPGVRLALVRDPGNPYDENAVRLLYEERMLGFVPRDENAAPAKLLDHGRRLEATIVRVNPSAPPWRRVRVRLELTS